MRCKACKGAILAVDLMPRLIAVTGEPDDFDWNPEIKDEDVYEASETIGFGCETHGCPNHHMSLGNITKGNHNNEWWTFGNELTDVAETGDPT